VSLAAANNANKIAVLIDDDTNAREISAAAAAAGATITGACTRLGYTIFGV
jgi:hypothetical protein